MSRKGGSKHSMGLNIGSILGQLLVLLVYSMIAVGFTIGIDAPLRQNFGWLKDNWTAAGGLFSIAALVCPYIPFLIEFSVAAAFLGVGIKLLQHYLNF